MALTPQEQQAVRALVLANMQWHGRSMCPHCSGSLTSCPGCGEPTIAPSNGSRFCHRCGSRLTNETGEAVVPGEGIYQQAIGAGQGLPKGVGSSGRGPSAAERTAFLDRTLPVHERIQAAEENVARVEFDCDVARASLQSALADLKEGIHVAARAAGVDVPASAMDQAVTLVEQAAAARADAAGRSLAPDLAAKYRAVFESADAFGRCEDRLHAARSRTAWLLERDAEERRMSATVPVWNAPERTGHRPLGDPMAEWERIKAGFRDRRDR